MLGKWNRETFTNIFLFFTFLPLFLHSAKTCFKFSSFLPTMATEAPSFENKTAVAAPIPELAPIEKKMKPEKKLSSDI